jgi:hypothetical protein
VQKYKREFGSLLKEIAPRFNNNFVQTFELNWPRTISKQKNRRDKEQYRLFKNMKILSSLERLINETSVISFEGTIACMVSE